MYYRNCPKCGIVLTYKTLATYRKAEKKNTLGVCCTNHSHKHSEEMKNHLREKATGYKHTKESLQKISQASCGKNNPMYKKSVYDVWLYKYGKEIADQKQNALSIKRSKNSIGNKNPMFGRPSPQGSGNGWSGWYKNIYFRSLLELSYLKYLIDHNIAFEIAEKRKYSIKYINSYGKEKNYFADFYLIDTQELIEVKPKKLVNSPSNELKFAAARAKFNFKIITEDECEKISKEEIKAMHESKDLIWIDRYEIKYQKLKEENK